MTVKTCTNISILESGNLLSLHNVKSNTKIEKNRKGIQAIEFQLLGIDNKRIWQVYNLSSWIIQHNLQLASMTYVEKDTD